ncbi:MAG: CHASE domain-containing protein [Solirubrobacterales bacterium]
MNERILPHPLALISLAVALVATLAAWWNARAQTDQLAETRFMTLAEGTVDDIRERMGLYEEILRGALGMMEASGEVSPTEWGRYVARLALEQRYPGIQGVGYAARASWAGIPELEMKVRAEGRPDFTVTPAGPRAEVYPIVMLDPLDDRNLRALGFDMFSEPIRRAAMEQARDTGHATMTRKVTLVQEIDQDVQAGTLLYLPVYRVGSDQSSVEARRKAILGFVYSPFRMNDLMKGTLGRKIEDMCLQVFDEQADKASLLYRHCPSIGEGRHVFDRTIEVFGRQWIIKIESTRALEGQIGSGAPLVILIAGIIISLLLMGTTQAMVDARQHAAQLAESNRQTEIARQNAEAANASKSRFLAAASHDLRQPLQSLGIYLYLLNDAEMPSATKELVRAATSGYETTQRMLNSIMDIAALESGKIDVRPERFNLAEMLTATIEAVRPVAEGKGLRLAVRTCPAIVETDRVLLDRIIRNLIDNALKYTESGGVLVACRLHRNRIRIKVADSGPGIAADRLELIFEDFYQVENPERDRTKGLGLGLATVARLARLLSYRIDVKSRPGRGSTFILELPAA